MNQFLALSVAALISLAEPKEPTQKCCLEGFKLHPNIQWNEENTTITTTLRETDDLCVRHEGNDTRGTPTTTGLPNCQRHSMVVNCNITADGVTAGQPSKCHGTSCQDDTCWDEVDGVFSTLSCPCLSSVCIRKCCGYGQVFNATAGYCVASLSLHDWVPDIEAPYTLLLDSLPPMCETPHLLKIPEYLYNDSKCLSKEQLKNRNQFSFNLDGSITVQKYGLPLPPEAYCGEHTIHEDGVVILNNLVVCLPQEVPTRPQKFDIYGALLITGGCFLLLTVIISCSVRELWSKLYHKVAICHNFSLMVASFTWGTTNLLPSVTYGTCVSLSLVIQFTFLSSFFWMNVMCIDIALAFKTLRSVLGPAIDEGWKSLFWYSIYAWGFPVLLTCLTAVMELSPNVPQTIPRPGFGCKNCGFNPDTYAILIYFYGPMIFVLVFNFALFVMTLLRIRSVEKQTAIAKPRGIRNSQEIQQVILFTKMFLLMGLTWGMEVIGWWIGGPAALWYLPDLINFLRSLFICFLFIGKKSVISAVKLKICGKLHADRRESGLRRSKSTSIERREQDVERRGRIFAKRLSQTFRSSESQM